MSKKGGRHPLLKRIWETIWSYEPGQEGKATSPQGERGKAVGAEESLRGENMRIRTWTSQYLKKKRRKGRGSISAKVWKKSVSGGEKKDVRLPKKRTTRSVSKKGKNLSSPSKRGEKKEKLKQKNLL